MTCRTHCGVAQEMQSQAWIQERLVPVVEAIHVSSPIALVCA